MVETGNSTLFNELLRHERGLEGHLKKASEFLVKCQVMAPYVAKGTLRGCVCPWEIGESADEGAFPILEDFHDTLEAIWVWSLYSKVGENVSFRPNIDWAWKYVISNWKRFIGNGNRKGKGLYDCSYVLFSGTSFELAFNDSQYKSRFLLVGNRLAEYLSTLELTEGREYYDPFWMAYCLEIAARKSKQDRWHMTAEAFVRKNVVDVNNSFTPVNEEPTHKGPGGHDFFSKNANMALALIIRFGHERGAEDILLTKFLPCISAEFVARRTDENAWNAHLATSIGRSYVLTGKLEFLHCFLAIMSELAKRDHGTSALSRSPSFGRRESWVTFFYAHAYASVINDLAVWV